MSKVSNPSLDILEAYEIPTGSFVAAIQYLNDLPQLRDDEYQARISELVGYDCTVNVENLPRYAYLYLVQELIKASQSTDVINVVAVYEVAYDKAATFIEENSYIFAEKDDSAPTKLDATGAPKPRKGKKKEMAIRVYAEDIEGKNLQRKDAIAILMEKVGMSAGGASTYYANLKNGKM